MPFDFGRKVRPGLDRKKMRMRTVLIPLDGSSFAEEALDLGLDHCSKGDQLVLVQCIDLNLLYAHSGEFSPQTIRELEQADQKRCRDYLDSQVARLNERGFCARARVALGEPVDGILRAAKEENASLILLTTHGRGGLARLLLGSIAEGVLRRALCPVLIVPSSARGALARP